MSALAESLTGQLPGFKVTEVRRESPGWRAGPCPQAYRLTVMHLASGAEFDCRLMHCTGRAFMKMRSPMLMPFKEHGLDITAAWILKKLEGPAGSAKLGEELRALLLNTTQSSG